MAFEPALHHDQLLTLARKAEAAARDGDRGRLEADTLRLFEALMDHVGAERADLLRVPAGESRLLQRGQQRVIDALMDLALASQSPEPCRCDSLAQQLVAQLTLQAEDERLSLAGVGPHLCSPRSHPLEAHS